MHFMYVYVVPTLSYLAFFAQWLVPTMASSIDLSSFPGVWVGSPTVSVLGPWLPEQQTVSISIQAVPDADGLFIEVTSIVSL